jgi:histidinol-phosphate/aromatic aminotransferase/cobyric acid decarboxylase-like protein
MIKAIDQRIPQPGQHGGDGHRIAAALGLDPSAVVDLSASMNPFAPDAGALIRDELDRTGSAALTSYPDQSASARVLADALGVDAERLVLTNGGAEAIALVAAHDRVGHVVDPEFSLYTRHLERTDPSAPRWRSNPSNPLGVLAAADDRAGVWDEAFYPLATGQWTRGDDAGWRLGSLTKLWNCPGLRLGYVIAPHPTAAQAIRDRQPAWAVNGLALAVLPRLLDRTDLRGWRDKIGGLRGELVAALGGLDFAVVDTAANWVLVDHTGLRSELAAQGVVVRDCTSFGLDGVHRVAVPTPDMFERVIAAFAAVIR